MLKVILWADDPDQAVPVRAQLRADGHTGMIRDARAFAGPGDAERCDAIAFVNAGRRDMILSAYRSESYQSRYGAVQVFDVETGKFGEALSALPIEPAKIEPTQGERETDLLRQRLDNLDDDGLRAYARGVLNRDIEANASREDIEALLRQAEPGEGKTPIEGVKPIEPPAAAPEAAAADAEQGKPADEPPAADAGGEGKPGGGRGRNKARQAE